MVDVASLGDDQEERRRQQLFDRRYKLLELKERKADRNVKIREIEANRDLKEREIRSAEASGVKVTAGQATVVAAVIALLGGVIGGLVQGWFNRDVERNKNITLLSIEDLKSKASIALEKQKEDAEEKLNRFKFETTLILKATEPLKREDQIKNLKFFLNAGFITDIEHKIANMNENSYPTTTSPVAPAVIDEQIRSNPLAKRASVEALNILIISEIGSKEMYEKNLSHPYAAPGGITIGLGYSLGYVSVEQFQHEWGDTLGPEAMQTLSTVVGTKGFEVAKSVVGNLSGVTVTWKQAVNVFMSKTMPGVESRIRLALPNVDELPPESYGALLDLVYDRGTGFLGAGSSDEMRAIRTDMEGRQFSSIPSELRRMASHPGVLMGSAKRREAEAALFEKGIGTTPH